MTTEEIYTRYRIPLNLREHQYRVASVGAHILDSWKDDTTKPEQTILFPVLLLHDMGNIIKFAFVPGDVFVPDDEITYWQEVQKEFIVTYGSDEHAATIAILHELSMPSEVINIFEHEPADGVYEGDNIYEMLYYYCDCRIGPKGVVSLSERIDDLLTRYKNRNHILGDPEVLKRKLRALKAIEDFIQQKVEADLSKISDELLSTYQERLINFSITT